MDQRKAHAALSHGRLAVPPRVPLPGIYIEPGELTPPELRHEIEMSRAAVVLPIPYRPERGVSLEASLRAHAIEAQKRLHRRLRPGDCI